VSTWPPSRTRSAHDSRKELKGQEKLRLLVLYIIKNVIVRDRISFVTRVYHIKDPVSIKCRSM
jgi:hypothetical protein